MIRRAVVLCSLLVANAAVAQGEAPFTELLERARAEDARTEHAAAAALYEEYANACLAQPTAVLEPAQPCAELGVALERAFELARALGDSAAAERIAARYAEHLLYAEPRAAMRVGYDLARMHIDAGRLDRADGALAEWVEQNPDPPVGHAILVDAMRARIATALGRTSRAASYWRRVERRYEQERELLDDDTAVPIALVHEAVAEGRLIRAEAHVQRFLAIRPPRATGIRDEDELWTRVVLPWRVRMERRLYLARYELERVYDLASPRHSVIAAARIGELYGHVVALHQALDLYPLSELDRLRINRGISGQPGYEEARTHFETCVTWANHHRVASHWAQRCNQSLHSLDPDRYPMSTELLGEASFIPASVAVPDLPER